MPAVASPRVPHWASPSSAPVSPGHQHAQSDLMSAPPSPSPLLSGVGGVAAATAAPSPSPSEPHELDVLVSHSGCALGVSWSGSESVAWLREQVGARTAVAPADQVLLLGADGSALVEGKTAAVATPAPTPVSGRLLQQYAQLQQEGATVFLFHRRYALATDPSAPAGAFLLSPPSLPPSLLQPTALPSEEAIDAAVAPRPALAAGNILVRTLPQYERQLCAHALEGEAHVAAFDGALRHAAAMLEQQEIILTALDIALYNLQGHAAHMAARVEVFRRSFEPLAKDHRALLDHWAADVERLAEVEVVGPMRRYLHAPAAAQDDQSGAAGSTAGAAAAATSSSSPQQRVTLHSCLSPILPALSQLHARCTKEQSILDAKVADMLDAFRRLEDSIRALLGGQSPASLPRAIDPATGVLPPIPHSLHRAASIIEPLKRAKDMLCPPPADSDPASDAGWCVSQRSTLESLLGQLRSDFAQAVSFCDSLERALPSLQRDPAASTSASSFLPDLPLQPNAARDQFEQMDEVHHSDLLPQFRRAADRLRTALLLPLTDAAVAVQSVFVREMREIQAASVNIRNVEAGLPLLLSAHERLDSLFKPSLAAIGRLPSAYAQLLHEIHRRRVFRRSFEIEVQGMSNRLAKLCEEQERPRRTRFHKEHAAFLPPGTPVTVALPGGGRSTQWVGGFGALLKQLQDRPPRLDLSFPDFDSGLPDLEASSLPMLPAAAASPSSHSAPSTSASSGGSMSRSASGRDLVHTLPVIDETRPTLEHGASGNGDGAGTGAGAGVGAAAQLAADFPWMQELESTQRELAESRARNAELAGMEQKLSEALARAADLEAQLKVKHASSTIAASLTHSSKPTSRKASLHADTSSPSPTASAAAAAAAAVTGAGATTSSPLLSSRSSGGSGAQSRRELDLLSQISEHARNNAALESARADLQRTVDDKTELIQQLSESLKRAQEDLRRLGDEHKAASAKAHTEMVEMSERTSTLFRNHQTLQSEMTKTQAELDMTRAELEAAQLHNQQLANRAQFEADTIAEIADNKIAIENLVVTDKVLFVRHTAPPAADAAAAAGASSSSAVVLPRPPTQLEAWTLERSGHRYFLSDDSSAVWHRICAQKQEHLDAAMAAKAEAEGKEQDRHERRQSAAAAAQAQPKTRFARAAKEAAVAAVASIVAAGGGAAATHSNSSASASGSSATPASPAAPAAAAAAAAASSSGPSSSSSSASPASPAAAGAASASPGALSVAPTSAPTASPTATALVAELTARIILVQKGSVANAADSHKYGLPIGAPFYLLDVNEMKEASTDTALPALPAAQPQPQPAA